MKLKIIIISLLVIVFIPMTTSFAQDEPRNDIDIKELWLPFELSEPRIKPITHIMIHSISNVISKPDSPFSIADVYFILLDYGVSTHYVINRQGDIFQLVPESRIAYHAGRSSLPDLVFFDHTMNEYSIGIELMGIGTREEMVSMISEEIYDSLDANFIGFTSKQYEALLWLMEKLYVDYPTIPMNRYHVIGHDDYASGRKHDPGKLFNWKKLNIYK